MLDKHIEKTKNIFTYKFTLWNVKVNAFRAGAASSPQSRDPLKHVEGKTYFKITKLLQTIDLVFKKA